MTPPSPKTINPTTCAQRAYIDDACAEAAQCAAALGPNYAVIRTEYIAPLPQADGPFAYTKCEVRYSVWNSFFNYIRQRKEQQGSAGTTSASTAAGNTTKLRGPTAHRTGTIKDSNDAPNSPAPAEPIFRGGPGRKW